MVELAGYKFEKEIHGNYVCCTYPYTVNSIGEFKHELRLFCARCGISLNIGSDIIEDSDTFVFRKKTERGIQSIRKRIRFLRNMLTEVIKTVFTRTLEELVNCFKLIEELKEKEMDNYAKMQINSAYGLFSSFIKPALNENNYQKSNLQCSCHDHNLERRY